MFREFFKPPPPEPPPIACDPPIQWVAVYLLLDWLARPGAPVCVHAHKDTIHFLIDHDLPIDPMLRWLRANDGYCDCKVLSEVGGKYPRHAG